MKHILYLFALLILLLSSCYQQSEKTSESQVSASIIDDAAKMRIDTTLNWLVESGRIAGISALIWEKNQEVYFNAYGYADREARTPMSRNTIATIYSMTKPITGTALMSLYEQGKFQLDDPLSKYAPEFADMQVMTGIDEAGNLILEKPNREITIRDITRHTAGFVNSTAAPGVGPLLLEADPTNWNNTLTQMAEKLGQIPLMYHPGEQWAYGPSVDVQAFLVERLADQPYQDYLRANVLDPLGLAETRYFVPETDRSRMSALYRRDETGGLLRLPEETMWIANTEPHTLTPGGWGLTSTLDDYMKFARMLVNKGSVDGVTILKPETVELMATNHLADSVTERMWLPSKGQVGFGIDFAVRIRPPASVEENNGYVGEFFWDGAASTLFWVDPVNELTAVLFVQIFPFDNMVHKVFRDAVYGAVKLPNTTTD